MSHCFTSAELSDISNRIISAHCKLIYWQIWRRIRRQDGTRPPNSADIVQDIACQLTEELPLKLARALEKPGKRIETLMEFYTDPAQFVLRQIGLCIWSLSRKYRTHRRRYAENRRRGYIDVLDCDKLEQLKVEHNQLGDRKPSSASSAGYIDPHDNELCAATLSLIPADNRANLVATFLAAGFSGRAVRIQLGMDYTQYTEAKRTIGRTLKSVFPSAQTLAELQLVAVLKQCGIVCKPEDAELEFKKICASC